MKRWELTGYRRACESDSLEPCRKGIYYREVAHANQEIADPNKDRHLLLQKERCQNWFQGETYLHENKRNCKHTGQNKRHDDGNVAPLHAQILIQPNGSIFDYSTLTFPSSLYFVLKNTSNDPTYAYYV